MYLYRLPSAIQHAGPILWGHRLAKVKAFSIDQFVRSQHGIEVRLSGRKTCHRLPRQPIYDPRLVPDTLSALEAEFLNQTNILPDRLKTKKELYNLFLQIAQRKPSGLLYLYVGEQSLDEYNGLIHRGIFVLSHREQQILQKTGRVKGFSIQQLSKPMTIMRFGKDRFRLISQPRFDRWNRSVLRALIDAQWIEDSAIREVRLKTSYKPFAEFADIDRELFLEAAYEAGGDVVYIVNDDFNFNGLSNGIEIMSPDQFEEFSARFVNHDIGNTNNVVRARRNWDEDGVMGYDIDDSYGFKAIEFERVLHDLGWVFSPYWDNIRRQQVFDLAGVRKR